MKNKFYVYGLYEPLEDSELDNCFYIGKGSGNRLNDHFTPNKLNENNTHVHNYHKVRKIKKIQRNNMNPYGRIIFNNLREKRAYELEKDLIKEIGIENLTNITLGGENPPTFSGENHHFYNKTGKDHPRGGKKNSERHNKILSEKQSGVGNPMYGKTGENHHFYGKNHSEETKKKISQSQLGKKRGERSEETKRKISKAHRGEKSHRAKLSKKEAQEIKWLSLNSNMLQKNISEKYDVVVSVVSRIKNGRRWGHIKAERPENF